MGQPPSIWKMTNAKRHSNGFVKEIIYSKWIEKLAMSIKNQINAVAAFHYISCGSRGIDKIVSLEFIVFARFGWKRNLIMRRKLKAKVKYLFIQFNEPNGQARQTRKSLEVQNNRVICHVLAF